MPPEKPVPKKPVPGAPRKPLPARAGAAAPVKKKIVKRPAGPAPPILDEPKKKPKKVLFEMSKIGIILFSISIVLTIVGLWMGYVTVRRFLYKYNMRSALAAYDGGQFPAAVDFALAASRWTSANPDPWVVAGLVRTRMGDYAGAREAFGSALTARPSPPVPAAHVGLGVIALREADAMDAAAEAAAIEAKIAEAEGHFGAAGGVIEARIGLNVAVLERGVLLGNRNAVTQAASALEAIRGEVEAGTPVRWGSALDLYASLACARGLLGEDEAAAAYYFVANTLAPDSPSLRAGAISLDSALLLRDLQRPEAEAQRTSVDLLVTGDQWFGPIIGMEFPALERDYAASIHLLRPAMLNCWASMAYAFAVRGRLNRTVEFHAGRLGEGLMQHAPFAGYEEAPIYAALVFSTQCSYSQSPDHRRAAIAYAAALAHHGLEEWQGDAKFIAILNQNHAAHHWNSNTGWQLTGATSGILRPATESIERALAAAPEDPALRYHIHRNRAMICFRMSTLTGLNAGEAETMAQRAEESFLEAERLAGSAGVPPEDLAGLRRFLGRE